MAEDTGNGSAPDPDRPRGLSRLRGLLYGRTAMMLRLALIVPLAILLARSALRDDDRSGSVDYGTAPAFALKNQKEETVETADLRGHPWVATFIFTRCPSVCPLLTAKFANLQKRTEDLEHVRFVSFSVDPEHDTPEVLSEYAAKYDADPERWWFLTGSNEAMQDAVVRGFKVHVGERQATEQDPTIYDIAHGEYFVLVDAAGTIRGYFDASAAGLSELEHSLRSLD